MRPKRMQKAKQTYVFMSSGCYGSLSPTKPGLVKFVNIKFHWNLLAGLDEHWHKQTLGKRSASFRGVWARRTTKWIRNDRKKRYAEKPILVIYFF